MDNTVLQQGDKIGTKGDAGAAGATGATGANGAFTNVLSVELVYTIAPLGLGGVTLAKTYVVEQGATNFWKANALHSYINSAYATKPAKTTISSFLVDTTKKFSVHLEQLKTKTNQNGVILLLPALQQTSYKAEIYDKSADNIVMRFIAPKSLPISFEGMANAGIRELTFSLLIIGQN